MARDGKGYNDDEVSTAVRSRIIVEEAKSGSVLSSVVDNKRKQSVKHCGDGESYYFESLNECYRIYRSQFLYVDPDRKIAYGGTRNEYMFNCWEQYRGKLLDIGP